MDETDAAWQQRYKCEQILEVGCPRCGAKPHKWCDRAGDKLSKFGQRLLKAGTPPSHQERMWVRQGHAEHEFPALLAKQRPGCWDEAMKRTGKPAARAARGGCGPCSRERAIRAELNAPGFPVDFPCRHPAARMRETLYPQRWLTDRPCPECGLSVSVEVVVMEPRTIAYRCDRGHKWLARTPRCNGDCSDG